MLQAIAQTDTISWRKNHQTVLGIHFLYGSVFVHTKKVEDTRGANPRGFSLEYSKQLTDETTYQRWGLYARNGWKLTYFDYNSAILGKSVSGSYFIEPIFKMGNSWELRAQASVGLSYLTNPFDSIKNPGNHSYSLPVNAYLQLAVGATVHVGKHLSVYAQATYNHNSNGGFQMPNSGVNYPEASIGFLYHTVSNKLPGYKKRRDGDNTPKNKRLPEVWVGIYGSPKEGFTREGTDSMYKRALLGGITVEVSKQVSNINTLLIGAEVYYDGGIKLTKGFINDPSSGIFAGILAGNEFLFNRIGFSQQLGFYLYKNTDYYVAHYQGYPFSSFYQRYGLRYTINSHWKAGINMLAHADVADFIDARVLYRF
ncbi:hypothetical protein F5148DRAFT_1289968 [Russula earlei]|uniref:Uncharacterized protein n=1 Tax=Russula earlei TaxID=71964 RepID=A0ACC0TY00_9AGAM|nr:hypothetical protein F5148DRAFT_1289968 [Russula earlei]